MFKVVKEKFKNIDKSVKNIMLKGIKFSFAFCIFSAIILLVYNFYMLPIIYYSGTILFKTSLMFISYFIVLGVGFDTIKKQMA